MRVAAQFICLKCDHASPENVYRLSWETRTCFSFAFTFPMRVVLIDTRDTTDRLKIIASLYRSMEYAFKISAIDKTSV